MGNVTTIQIKAYTRADGTRVKAHNATVRRAPASSQVKGPTTRPAPQADGARTASMLSTSDLGSHIQVGWFRGIITKVAHLPAEVFGQIGGQSFVDVDVEPRPGQPLAVTSICLVPTQSVTVTANRHAK